MNAHSSAAHLDTVSAVFTLVLQNGHDNALHEAVTFSRLMCANQQLQSRLLAAAEGRVTLDLSYRFLMAEGVNYRSLVLWLLRHLRLGTLRRVDLLTEQLKLPLQDYATLVTRACGPVQSSYPLIDRLASVLGSAAAYPGAILPKVERWYCRGEFVSLCSNQQQA
jgi:hypothetical protein